MNKLLQKFVLVGLLLATVSANAQKVEIEIPDEELPSERVFPKLDSPAAVLSRKLTFAKKFEVRLHTGWMLDDPFYNNNYMGFLVAYHLNELHGFGFKFQKWAEGMSDYSAQLAKAPNNVEISKAPGPDSSLSAIYEYKAFYGKVSFSQSNVIQFVMAGELELGMMKYGSRSLPLLGVGGSQKMFFTKHWGAQLDLRFLVHQALDPNSVVLRRTWPGYNANPQEGDFDTRTQISNELNLSVMYLF